MSEQNQGCKLYVDDDNKAKAFLEKDQTKIAVFVDDFSDKKNVIIYTAHRDGRIKNQVVDRAKYDPFKVLEYISKLGMEVQS